MRAPRSVTNTIYFVRAGFDGTAVKIGCCNEDALRFRIHGLQAGNHRPLIVIRTIPGTRQKETWLHKYFHERHLRGEWFSFCDEMMTVIPSDDFSTLPGPNAMINTHIKQGRLLSNRRRPNKYGAVVTKIYDPDCPVAA